MYRPSPAMKREKNVFSSGRIASRDLPLSHGHGQTNVRLVGASRSEPHTGVFN